MSEALDSQAYVTEARVAPGSPAEGKAVSELASALDEDVRVTSVMREGGVEGAACDTILREGDIVLLEGAPDALERTIAKESLDWKDGPGVGPTSADVRRRDRAVHCPGIDPDRPGCRPLELHNATPSTCLPSAAGVCSSA